MLLILIFLSLLSTDPYIKDHTVIYEVDRIEINYVNGKFTQYVYWDYTDNGYRVVEWEYFNDVPRPSRDFVDGSIVYRHGKYNSSSGKWVEVRGRELVYTVTNYDVEKADRDINGEDHRRRFLFRGK